MANRWLLMGASAALAARAGLVRDDDPRARLRTARHHTDTDILHRNGPPGLRPAGPGGAIGTQLCEDAPVNVISKRNGKKLVSHVGLVVPGR